MAFLLCDSLSAHTSSTILTEIVKGALRKPSFACDVWKQQESGIGLYLAEEHELTLDVQAAQVLWRNDGLRPVPDSMTQMGDYEVGEMIAFV